MKILSKITPAETMLVKNSDSVKLKDLMKFTFMDLLLKRVIEIKEVNKRAHPRDKYIRTYTYVISGKNFSQYKPKNHELIFLSPYFKSKSIQILFKNFIKMVYDSSNGNWNYTKSVRSNKGIDLNFKQTFFTNLFRLNVLTAKGIEVQKKIVAYLNMIDNMLLNDNKKGLELLLNIGGNIFLLENLDFQLLKKIDKELIIRQKNLYKDTYDSDSDWELYFDFFEDEYRFDSYFESFDDTLDSFGSEFDASGCSSCDSGCGGCD